MAEEPASLSDETTRLLNSQDVAILQLDASGSSSRFRSHLATVRYLSGSSRSARNQSMIAAVTAKRRNRAG